MTQLDTLSTMASAADPGYGLLPLIIAAVATIAAAVSAISAVYTVRLQIRWKYLETESRYYDLTVAQPVLIAVTSFRDLARSIFAEISHESADLRKIKDGNLKALDDACAKANGRFLEAQVSLMHIATNAAEIWNDEALRKQLRDTMEELQELGQEYFQRLRLDDDVRRDFEERLYKLTGKVISHAKDSDPAISDRNTSQGFSWHPKLRKVKQ